MIFRDLIAKLDDRGELLRVSKPVDLRFELPALLAQAEARGKAVRFDNVAGADFPAVGAALTSARRWALGIGVPIDSFDAPNSLEQFMADAVAGPVPARAVQDGPVAARVIDGDAIDVGRLPAPLFFSGDSHRFISAGLGFTIDPDSGTQNVGFYRIAIVDERTVSVSAGPTSDLRRIYNLHRERGSKLQLAVAVGMPPALQIAAAADLPAGVPDVDVAGALQRSPIDLVRCRTSDVLVPAEAEFVIELTVDLDTWIENTMGEFGDLYGTTSSPVASIDAITHRSDAQFHVIMAGMHREHNELGRMLGYSFRTEILKRLRGDFPGVRDVCVDMTPQQTSMRAQVAVSVDKAADDEPGKIIESIFAMQIGRFPMGMLLQRVVVVDVDVDIRNQQDVDWAIASRMNSADQLSVAESKTGRGATMTRLGFDATAPLAQREVLRRPDIPGAEKYALDDYIDGQ
ncbi:MAG: UbiD family decarboxylase domain-containing protein [Gammaproteobacteria bacterium]